MRRRAGTRSISRREAVLVANLVTAVWIWTGLGDRVPAWEPDQTELDLVAATVNVFGRPLLLTGLAMLAYVNAKVTLARWFSQTSKD